MGRHNLYNLISLKNKIEDRTLNNIASQMLSRAEDFFRKQEKQEFSLKIETELPSGQIHLDTLSIMSNGIQHLYSNIYNYLYGNTNEKGPLPKNISMNTKLILSEAVPGSYDMRIAPEKINLFIDSNTVIEDFLKRSIEEDNYIDLIEKFGVRSFKSYAKWIKDINYHQISFSFKSPAKDRIFLTKDLLLKIEKNIENTSLITETENIVIQGTLSKIDTTSKKLRIDSDEETITATVHKSTPMDGLISEIVEYRLSGIKETSYYPHSNSHKIEIIIDNINDTLK